ncbi:MAG: GGDEF domain-containing protein [Candidatus Omnitrophica bacterium]|nr:GGDEF domain-containing protein [Candidatus Omnitrophota bacterium]
MILLDLIFLFSFVYFAKRIISEKQKKEKDKLFDIQERLKRISKSCDNVVRDRKEMERKATEIFTLYDITKEITKTLSEQKAFEVFREALKVNVFFEECRLVHSEGDRRKNAPDPSDHFIFPIKGRRKELGYIAIKGLLEKDKEKFIILAQQFGLALQRVRLYQEVEKAAITDSLTGVHTRRYLMERFEEEIQRALIRKRNLSFLMIDVDYFKAVNDQHGHLVGDQVLRSVSLLIQENVREIDLAGRYGGEEFCVVLPDTDTDGSFFVAERIRKAIEENEIQAYDAKVRVTVSLGVSCFPVDGESSAELIDKADGALYRSKKRGRNCTSAFGQ